MSDRAAERIWLLSPQSFHQLPGVEKVGAVVRSLSGRIRLRVGMVCGCVS